MEETVQTEAESITLLTLDPGNKVNERAVEAF